MLARTKLTWLLWTWLPPAAGIAALALACFFYFHSPRPRRYDLTLTAGNARGMRQHLAVRLAEESARRQVALEVRPSAGSGQALDWVNSHRVDVALVQGGLATDEWPDVRQIATLHIEPMLLMVKKELQADVTTILTALRGKSVDLEEVSSGSHLLASAILNFVGLAPRERGDSHGYIPLNMDRQALLAEQDETRLPDAVFLVSTLPSPTARFLVTRHGYRLVPLPFAEAFALESLADPPAGEQQGTDQRRIEPGRIHATTIPAFACGVDPPVPAKPLSTLGTRLLLVAHKDVPVKAVYSLVEATYAAEFGRVIHPPLDAKLLELPPEFPWHEGALVFQQRNMPLLSGAAMDSAHKGMAILAAAASGLFVLWQWAKQHGQLARNQGFTKHIGEATRIERQAMEAERDHPLAVPELVALRDELVKLKARALEEFTREGPAGRELLVAFLVQINDVRDSLNRLILESDGGAHLAYVREHAP
jgi:TRAP-type uncharacterized transport system substrate-binding protein